MDGTASGGVCRQVPGESHGLSRGDGRARPVREAVSALCDAGAADRARRARGELLPDVPDRRAPARGPRLIEAPEGRLAEVARRARTAARETFWHVGQK